MAAILDHFTVPVRDKIAAAKRLAGLLGVPWSETGVGPFAPVYVNDGLTLDFDETTDPFPILHFCFRVAEDEFDRIPGADPCRRHPVPQRGPRAGRQEDRHGARRPHRLLERPRGTPVGAAHPELRAAAPSRLRAAVAPSSPRDRGRSGPRSRRPAP